MQSHLITGSCLPDYLSTWPWPLLYWGCGMGLQGVQGGDVAEAGHDQTGVKSVTEVTISHHQLTYE